MDVHHIVLIFLCLYSVLPSLLTLLLRSLWGFKDHQHHRWNLSHSPAIA